MTQVASNSGRGTVKLGSCIGGIPVTLHYSFFLLLLFQFVTALLYLDYPIYMIYIVILYGPVLLVTVVVHEFGHALMTKKLGGQVEGIILWPLGGLALCGPTEDLRGDMKVAVAGPVAHIPMAILWWGIYLGVSGSTDVESGLWPEWTIYLDVLSESASGFFHTLSSEAFYMNLILLCFNLFIPAYPLDGGRIYAAALILFLKLKPLTAAKVTAITAMLLSAAMLTYAAITFFLYLNLGGGILSGIVGAYIFYNSYILFQNARNDNLNADPLFSRPCVRCQNTGASHGEQEQVQGVNHVAPISAQSDTASLT